MGTRMAMGSMHRDRLYRDRSLAQRKYPKLSPDSLERYSQHKLVDVTVTAKKYYFSKSDEVLRKLEAIVHYMTLNKTNDQIIITYVLRLN